MKEKKYLLVDNYMVDKVLDKVKEIINTGKFDGTKILINTDDKLSDGIIYKKALTSLTCVIKGDDKFSQLFLDHALYDE